MNLPRHVKIPDWIFVVMVFVIAGVVATPIALWVQSEADAESRDRIAQASCRNDVHARAEVRNGLAETRDQFGAVGGDEVTALLDAVIEALPELECVKRGDIYVPVEKEN